MNTLEIILFIFACLGLLSIAFTFSYKYCKGDF